MAEESGAPAYTPVLVGSWQWDATIGDNGGWHFHLTHPVLLIGETDQGIGELVEPGGLVVIMDVNVARKAITGIVWQPNPGEGFHKAVWDSIQTYKRLKDEDKARRAAFEEALPF